MTGRFNAETQRLLRESKANGGIGPQQLFDLLVAGHEEATETAAALARKAEATEATMRVQLQRIVSHLESETGHISEAVAETLRRHCDAMDSPMLLRISALESEHRVIQSIVDDRGAQIEKAKREVVAEILQAQQPRRKGDPEDADFAGGRALVVAERRFTREQVVVAVILFVAVVVSSNLIGHLMERLTQ